MSLCSPDRLRELANQRKQAPRAVDRDAMRDAADEIERLTQQLALRTGERDSWRAAYEAACKLHDFQKEKA